jgi:hypothetical protein
MRGRLSLLVALSVAALSVAAVAMAHPTRGANGARAARSTAAAERHYTAADQALARSVVLKASDLGSPSSWRGGISPADTSQPRTCSNFHPRQSDLVITGDVQSDYAQATGGLQYHDEAQIMRTANMVRLDWQRNVLDPAALPCLQTFFVQNLVGDQHFVSLKRLAVPHLATYTAGYRALVDQDGVRNMIDVLFVGRNRTEITLETSAPYADHAKVAQSELRLAKLLIARAPAHS